MVQKGRVVQERQPVIERIAIIDRAHGRKENSILSVTPHTMSSAVPSPQGPTSAAGRHCRMSTEVGDGFSGLALTTGHEPAVASEVETNAHLAPESAL
jgi:hypothetical protein